MTALPQSQHVSVENYLAGELVSQVKHEYLGGYLYAMAGARNLHNRIASNLLGALHGRLRGTPCRPYNSDTKIRVQLPAHVRFYYPDVSVICESNPPEESFQDRPIVIVEVPSHSTRRIDQGEKKDAYLTIPTLHAYLLVQQESPFVRAYRRTDQGFVEQESSEMSAVISLEAIGIELPLAEIYEGVEFAPEPEDEVL